jgi:hypothetical protein
LAGGEKSLKFINLKNSKGISVLFLVIAMLLMITIGYVFSYLIPTKQKSVRFPIYSTQALYIAQSGAEFAIRYASDQGWRGATDGVFDLTRLSGISRPFRNGTLTLAYTSPPSDTLTSTGQITGVSENRVVSVSRFTHFLILIFDPSSAAPCWCLGTRRARFYIRNVRGNPADTIILRSFSATWSYTGTARTLTRIFMNGTSRYNSNYTNGAAAVNLSSTQTITPGQLVTILVYWSNNVANGANINITFYTGTLGTGNSFKFNLDSNGNFLPTCTVGC